MSCKPLSRDLEQNILFLQQSFDGSSDFYTKKIQLCGIQCAIVLFTGISSAEKLCVMALEMLDRSPAVVHGGE